jgi:hypothetical protein
MLKNIACSILPVLSIVVWICFVALIIMLITALIKEIYK